MSTPTASSAAQPSSASKKPTDHVTPSRLGLSSPAPRSVPSPAATRREQAGKTPTNHPTTSSSHGSKTLGHTPMVGGTPMVQNLSQTGFTTSSSPGTHNASFTPSALAGLGVDMGTGTPGQINVPTPLLASTGMMPTMSELGLNASGGKRNEDEERRAKMKKVLKSIGQPKGRVNRAGIIRVARRVGFGWEEDPPTRTPLTIHGERLTVVDIPMKADVPSGSGIEVNIVSHVGEDSLKDFASPIGGVLQGDLIAPAGVKLKSTLDRFASNLSRMARLEKLSKDVNCYDALNGIYQSLRRLHEQEKNAVMRLGDGDISDDLASVRVTRKRSGKPVAHERGRFGLAVNYWIAENNGTLKSKNDGPAIENGQVDADEHDEIYSLAIDVEGSPGGMYPSLRISNAWLPDTFELPPEHSGEGIPWQDPPPSYAPEAGGLNDGIAIDSMQRLRLPDLRFVAKLEPPVVMPYQTAMNIFSAVGAQPPQQAFIPPQYHALLLNPPSEGESASDPVSVEADQNVLFERNGVEQEATHHYSLDISKNEWGFKLEEFPFAHPRQLVELLPTLRQWAHVGDLLRNALANGLQASACAQTQTNGVGHGREPGVADTQTMDLDDLLATASPPEQVQVNITLTTSPQPTVSVTYSQFGSVAVGNVTAQILPNADIVVTNYDGRSQAAGQNDNFTKMAKVLAACGDLGVWIEWMRHKGGRNESGT